MFEEEDCTCSLCILPNNSILTLSVHVPVAPRIQGFETNLFTDGLLIFAIPNDLQGTVLRIFDATDDLCHTIKSAARL